MTTPNSPPQAAPRFDTIDLLRGLAVLAVVLLHTRLNLHEAGIVLGKNLPPWAYFLLFCSGSYGVSTFFAISGFLITYISIRRFGTLGHMAPKKFYRIRFARIAPPLLLLLFILSAFHLANLKGFHIKPSVGTLPQALFAVLTFQANWFEAVHGYLPQCWTVLWSLSVEEMFYLFFPILCVVFLRKRWGHPIFLIVLCGLVAFGPFARLPWYTSNGIWNYQSYLGNMDNVAMGCLTAIITIRVARNSRLAKFYWLLVLQIVGALLMLFIFCSSWPKTILGWSLLQNVQRTGTDITIVGFGTCFVMFASVLRQASAGWWTAPLRWLGRYSYEVYLTHEFAVMGVVHVFVQVHHGPNILWIGVIVAASAVLGLIMARFVSEPMNHLLRGAPVPSELSRRVAAVPSRV